MTYPESEDARHGQLDFAARAEEARVAGLEATVVEVVAVVLVIVNGLFPDEGRKFA